MLNVLPKEIEGYIPSEVAYQVKEDTLHIYLRVVQFDLVQRTFEPLNKVDIVKISLNEIKEMLFESAEKFRASYPFVPNNPKPKMKKFRKDNFLFTYELVPSRKELHIEIAYSLGINEEVTLLKSVVSLNEDMKITSKCARLRQWFLTA